MMKISLQRDHFISCSLKAVFDYFNGKEHSTTNCLAMTHCQSLHLQHLYNLSFLSQIVMLILPSYQKTVSNKHRSRNAENMITPQSFPKHTLVLSIIPNGGTELRVELYALSN